MRFFIPYRRKSESPLELEHALKGNENFYIKSLSFDVLIDFISSMKKLKRGGQGIRNLQHFEEVNNRMGQLKSLKKHFHSSCTQTLNIFFKFFLSNAFLHYLAYISTS